MRQNLVTMVNDPAPIHPNTMLELIEAVMLQEGGEDHPWIPGASAKPLLIKLRATIAATKATGHCVKLVDEDSRR